MKFKFDIAWVLLLAVVGTLTFSAFDKPNTTHTALTTIEDENGVKTTVDADGNPVFGSDYYAGTNQQKIYALDTISAATTTYVSVPWNLSSAYQYQYLFRMRKIGVTPNVKIRLEEKNASNSSVWSAIDSVSMSGADSTKYFFRLRGTNTYGAGHRIAFVKTGTGAVARVIEFNVKATN